MANAIGMLASIMILICFMMNDERKIRIIDAIGAGLYVVYGFLIDSFPNVFMNAVLILIQVYKLIRLERIKHGTTKNRN